MNSSNYEERKKFNIVDALIILIVVIMVLVIIFRAQLVSLFNDNGTTKDVEISFVCEAIPNELLSSVTDGSSIVWVESDVLLGTLTLTGAPKNTEIVYFDNEGNPQCETVLTSSSFTGFVRGTAIQNNGCYIDGTDFLASGMNITLTNGKVQFEALITDVQFK